MDLLELAKQNQAGIGALTKSIDGLVEKLGRTPAAGFPGASEVFGMPFARTGESSMSSRGFSFAKMIGVLAGGIRPEEAKVEIQEVHNRLDKLLAGPDRGNFRYEYANGQIAAQPGVTRFLAPLSTKMLPSDWLDSKLRSEFRQMVTAGVDGADWGEMQHMRMKSLQAQGYSAKTLSWLNEGLGGALVAPPEMGELIELLRNKEALVNAGARVVPLPPQGRLTFPRQTAASLTYWIGENLPIAPSDVGTGLVTLQAKKLAVLIKSPNELIRFASPAAEALLRDDMTKSLALGLDLAALEGGGGDHRPRGIIQNQQINRIVSSKPNIGVTGGDGLVAEDAYRMVAAVAESNAEFEAYIMRPKCWYKYLQLRADAVGQGDRQGLFLFSAIREAGEGGGKPMLAGYPVTTSTQVSQVRSKTTTANNLTYILGGMFSDVLLGMFGALEFAATTMGDTPFQYDQTWVRGILSADVALRHEGAFALLDNIDVTA
jgi:HK97 family phage major capsid protein